MNENLDQLYNITNDLEIDIKKTAYIGTGIHENIELKNIEYNQTEESEYLAFSFEDEKGNRLSHTEYKPRMVNKPENTPEQNLSATKQRINNQLKRVGQIITTYIATDKYQAAIKNKQSFKEVATAIVSVLGDTYKGKKVRIKVVYDWQEKYTCLPNYSSFRFIESMSIPKEDSTIQILSIDTVERKNKPDVENNKDNNEFSLDI